MARQSTAKKRIYANEEGATATPPTATPKRPAAATGATTPHDDPGSATDLDRLIHERLRLGIVSALAVNAKLTFSELKRIMGTTDGNLSIHARKLEDAGYVLCVKSFDGRTPKTEFSLTAAGRRALERYLSHMETLIHATRNG
jgi:DNA-binding MarR family transcriptional regulator